MSINVCRLNIAAAAFQRACLSLRRQGTLGASLLLWLYSFAVKYSGYLSKAYGSAFFYCVVPAIYVSQYILFKYVG